MVTSSMRLESIRVLFEVARKVAVEIRAFGGDRHCTSLIKQSRRKLGAVRERKYASFKSLKLKKKFGDPRFLEINCWMYCK